MQRQKIIIIIGVVLALLAVVLIKVYLDQERQRQEALAMKKAQQQQASETTVLVARTEILQGTPIDPNTLGTKLFPNDYVAKDAVTAADAGRIVGTVAVATIPAGEQITMSRLAFPQQSGDLAGLTPRGKRAITVEVENAYSMIGMIKPQDYVDVIALVPVPVQGADGKMTTEGAIIPLFQNVQILAVGQQTSAAGAAARRYESQDEPKEPSKYITLALTPQEASLIAFVQEQGKIRLVLRSPTDTGIENVPPASWQTLFQYALPQQQVQATPEEPQASSYVEIYRGLNKQKVPIYK